jgi:hypothetical protein
MQYRKDMMMIEICKKIMLLLLVFMSIVSISEIAFADMIIGSSGSGWQLWTAGDLNQNGEPYWDNTSWDGRRLGGPGLKKNIGYCLTGTGNCILNNYPGADAFWGESSGEADPNFYFSGAADSAHNFTLELELAGFRDTNVFGWYEYNPISGQVVGKHVIFDGPDNPEQSANLPVSENYGFYLYVGATNETYYTQSQFNTADIGLQHFAVFRDNDVFWIGMEDLSLDHSDKDYNDMIVRDPVATPEPSTILLFSVGLIGTWVIRKRVKKNGHS